MLLAVHYVLPPEWRWYILGYFILAGLAGGTYTLGMLLRLWGRPWDEPAARLSFLLAFPLTLACPVLLTIDLGQPLRFWHMMADTGVAGPGLNFMYWSPMSLGVWGLLVFGVFATVSFLEVVARDGRYRYPGSQLVARVLGGTAGRVVNVVGTVFALFLAGYTGVLLSVSNQPVWSDTYALGGLFLASGLSGAAALLILCAPLRTGADASEDALGDADGFFALLEVAFLVVLFATLGFAGQLTRAVGAPWFVLWAIVVLSLLPPLGGRFAGRLTVGPGGTAAMTAVRVSAAATAVLVL
ncbi:MAG TPA: NrfD/PsrC family molybdoenzyme membrane anchor subunit, partial [Candidatus Eisenbacteria bacterium]|nr:NrfD/PsrC family molybdoenzyme membrane anchor subunit [Candidatus Eisenbacteria bacterium]